MPAGPLEPGDPRVLGVFQVVARLGEGGQGIVYEGRSPSGDRVAIKVLRGGTDPDTRRRLARELESARRVAPFCTARVLEAEPDRPAPYVVSEFVAGPSLQERVRAGGPLRNGDLERLAVGTACALAAIHGAGVVHRDFKPANVLLGPDGPRVVDFGIARPLDASTAPSTMSGTPPYMAPEQLKGEHASPAADVFAWAATMVYAATGRAPFGSDTVAAVFHRILTQEPDLSGIPQSLRETLVACLSKDPRSRPSARSLLIRLVDPGALTVTVPDVGPVPSAYVPPNWPGPGATKVLPTEPAPGPGLLPVDGPTVPAPPPAAPLGGAGSWGQDTFSASPHGERGIRRRIRPAMPLIAVTVAALATAGVLYARGAIGSPAAGDGATTQATSDTSASRPASTPSPARESASGSTTAPAPVGVPEAFAGTWTGQVHSQDDRKKGVDVRITLTGGQSTGTWVDGDCEQQATLTRLRSATVLEMTVAQRDRCVGGDMTLTLDDPGTLVVVRQEGASSLEYHGRLRRS
ncbi:serine/threonine protein kinase [Nonomuraea turkmeniaca]|uniref:non-specific serine/threonine protein kinase n=1 Tax=Nonomuraea turkmeniaca TaxID=103838 RepID=A0A5S4FMF7_9ACTN|nr:serine/threonine-protein kinase [Nonomuraea turkmeniaca]TMR21862.1 serine/threonine protein kinase [Nonomuraea turkmeniaca]